MMAWDFDAVVWDGEVYCVDCLPSSIDTDDDSVTPIFASDEWDYMPICCECGTEHDYMTILSGECFPTDDENLPIQEDDSHD